MFASVAVAMLFTAPLIASPQNAFDVVPANLDSRIQKVLPKTDEEKWLQVPWKTNLMETRLAAQNASKPMFIWIMVGNPQGCT